MPLRHQQRSYVHSTRNILSNALAHTLLYPTSYWTVDMGDCAIVVQRILHLCCCVRVVRWSSCGREERLLAWEESCLSPRVQSSSIPAIDLSCTLMEC